MNKPSATSLFDETFPTSSSVLLLICILPFFENIHILNFNLPIFSLEASVMICNDNVPLLNYTYVVVFLWVTSWKRQYPILTGVKPHRSEPMKKTRPLSLC